jgi:hypothetical protein
MIYKTSNTPKFIDGCNHKKDEYVGSFSYFSSLEKKEIWYDVYAYESDIFGQEFCIRYGNIDREYISPTSLVNIISSNFEPYKVVVEFLSRKGYIIFRKNKNE